MAGFSRKWTRKVRLIARGRVWKAVCQSHQSVNMKQGEGSSQTAMLWPDTDYKLTLIGLQPMAIRPLNLLFSQQTGCCLQELPPTPMTLRGEQVRPTATLAGTTSPKSVVSKEAVLSEAWVTELQHWTGPVLHEYEIPEDVLRRAVSTPVARRTGALGGRPRAIRCPLVSEGRALTAAAEAVMMARTVVNFMLLIV